MYRSTALARTLIVCYIYFIINVVIIYFLTILLSFNSFNTVSNRQTLRFREFTLKESFWFALTSFTPQGGGEAPKALSSRTLVAAYWLFVVLMLATFTANLAAFLTVERMQVSNNLLFHFH